MIKRPSIQISTIILLLCLPAQSSLAATPSSQQSIVLNITHGVKLDANLFQNIKKTFPADDQAQRNIGIGAIFSYLHKSPEQTKVELENFLALSEQFDIPIVIQLDGEQWWSARPDLWNFWDPSRPGYNPENRNNVEWSGCRRQHAIKIAWRNWGRQIRVLPPPNFASAAYRKACHKEMRKLVPIIMQWHNKLPPGKKHLLIALKLGWESAIGVNSFYYPNGNDLLDKPASEDPTTGLNPNRIPDRGVTAIGYAAVTTAKLANSGTLKEEHLAEIVRRHLEDLCALASQLGVPRDKLFTHIAGWKEEELLYDAAVNKYSCPGYSFYKYARNPQKDKGLQRALKNSNAPHWAAVEWLLMGNHDRQSWQNAITNTLSDHKCRYICIYNYRSIKNYPAAIEAIKTQLLNI